MHVLGLEFHTNDCLLRKLIDINKEYVSRMHKPDILQAPSKTGNEPLEKILSLYSTRLYCIMEYSKIIGSRRAKIIRN